MQLHPVLWSKYDLYKYLQTNALIWMIVQSLKYIPFFWGFLAILIKNLKYSKWSLLSTCHVLPIPKYYDLNSQSIEILFNRCPSVTPWKWAFHFLLIFLARNSFFSQPFKFSINFLGSALPQKSEASTADPRNLSQSAAKRRKGKKAQKGKKRC